MLSDLCRTSVGENRPLAAAEIVAILSWGRFSAVLTENFASEGFFSACGKERKMSVEQVRSKWKRSERKNEPHRVWRKRIPYMSLWYI